MQNSCDFQLEERLIELETKVSFQDRIIEELNDTVASLQLEMQNLQRMVIALRQKLPPNVDSIRADRIEI